MAPSKEEIGMHPVTMEGAYAEGFTLGVIELRDLMEIRSAEAVKVIAEKYEGVTSLCAKLHSDGNEGEWDADYSKLTEQTEYIWLYFLLMNKSCIDWVLEMMTGMGSCWAFIPCDAACRNTSCMWDQWIQSWKNIQSPSLPHSCYPKQDALRKYCLL